MVDHYAVNYRQAQSGSGSGRFCGKERFKNVGHDFRIHSTAAVCDPEQHIMSGGGVCAFGTELFIQEYICSFHLKFATVRHCVSCVEGNIHNDLFNLSGISRYGHQIITACHVYGNVLWNCTVQQFSHLLNLVIDFQRLESCLSLSGEKQ